MMAGSCESSSDKSTLSIQIHFQKCESIPSHHHQYYYYLQWAIGDEIKVTCGVSILLKAKRASQHLIGFFVLYSFPNEQMNEENEKKKRSQPNIAIGLKDYFCISNSICGILSHRLRAVFFFFIWDSNRMKPARSNCSEYEIKNYMKRIEIKLE